MHVFVKEFGNFKICYSNCIIYRDDRNCREEMTFLWNHQMPKQMKAPHDLFLRLMIHNRQNLADAGALKHYKPPATHWNKYIEAAKGLGLIHAWIIYAAQRALISTIAVLPAMDLRKINIQHTQKVLYNLMQSNLDFLFLKRHNQKRADSLLGSHFKTQLAQCTDLDSINSLVNQENFII